MRRHTVPLMLRRLDGIRRRSPVRGAPMLGALALLALVAVPSASAASPPQVAVTISGTSGSGGWYRSSVTVAWSVTDPTGISGSSGCGTTTLVNETSGTTLTCSASNNADPPLTSAVSVTIKIDLTAPSITGATPERAPDANGWYHRPVSFAFAGSDALSGLDTCPAAAYSGPDSADAGVTGVCRDKAGNAGSRRFSLRYDATAPQVSAAAERPPNGAGWYNRPVAVAFTGSDGASGVDACTSTTYGGPDSDAASVTGSCRDHAGNTGSASLSLRYDATAPVLSDVAVVPGDGVNTLRWRSTSPEDTVVVDRAPRTRQRLRKTIFRGATATGVADRSAANGVEYVYVVQSHDVAGNASPRVTRLAYPRVLVPGRSAPRVTGPPLLRWRPLRRASYYHVQLFRGSTRVLASWPRRAELALPAKWRFGGRRERLQPGRYRWFAWAGLGRRSAARYVRLSRGTFVVVRGLANPRRVLTGGIAGGAAVVTRSRRAAPAGRADR